MACVVPRPVRNLGGPGFFATPFAAGPPDCTRTFTPAIRARNSRLTPAVNSLSDGIRTVARNGGVGLA